MEKGNSLPLSLVARLLQLLQLSLNSINIINIIIIITMNIIIIPWKKSTKLYSRKLLSSLSLPRWPTTIFLCGAALCAHHHHRHQ